MHDVNILDQLVWEAGSSYIMDRGYLDFARWHRLHQCGAFFVTRAKQNFRCARRYSRPVDKTTGLRFDQTVVMTGLKAQHDYPAPLRDAYGRTPYGQSCLLARRLVESGVKFVQVYFSDSIGGQSTDNGGWDTHGFNNTRMFPIIEKRHLPITDQTLPTFLNDLESRGLLDTTLVVWVGEFGRTPRINANISRDHWPQCYTALLAGAGVKKGFVYGASDKHGEYPADKPVKPDDLAATIYHLLGIDPHTEVRDTLNRPVPISYGKVITDVMV